MKRSDFVLIFWSLLITNAMGQTNNEFVPRSQVAFKTNQLITIDGEADEKDWEKIAWSEEFIDIEGVSKPKYKTQMKMLWDETFFYVFVKMEEPHVWASLKERDTIIYYNNDFEIFVDPDGDTHNYYELELNAFNTLWDLFLTKPYREGTTVLNDWTATGLKSAIKVNGTLNNPKDIDQNWTIELAIPWAAFRKSYNENNVPIDQFWRFNFSRVNWDHDIVNGTYFRKKGTNGKFLKEYNWVWSPTGVINIHEPEKWGYIYFSSKKPGEVDQFKIPQEERIKWRLYEIHRALRRYVKKKKEYPTSIKDMIPSKFRIGDTNFDVTYERHSSGYNLVVVSPFSKKTFIVAEDGKFISK